jgi:hypothetical protein
VVRGGPVVHRNRVRHAELGCELTFEGGDFGTLRQLARAKDRGNRGNLFFADVRKHERY